MLWRFPSIRCPVVQFEDQKLLKICDMCLRFYSIITSDVKNLSLDNFNWFLKGSQCLYTQQYLSPQHPPNILAFDICSWSLSWGNLIRCSSLAYWIQIRTRLLAQYNLLRLLFVALVERALPNRVQWHL